MTRHASAMMNAMPSVTSTWPSTLPASLRNRKRSRSPPNAATARPPSSAAIHKFGTNLRIETPRYAPIMKSAPWVRFAILMRPKMSEKPDESRNSSPPRARLFSVWMTQNCMRLPPASRLARERARARQGARALRLEVLRRRVVARVRRCLEVLLGLVRPELAHVRVRVDHGVHQPPLFPLDLADVDVADDVTVLVELDRSAHRVDLDRAHRLHERFLVLDLAADGVQRRLEHCGLGIGRRGVEARVVLDLGPERGRELLVLRIVELGRVPARGEDAERLVAHVAQHRLVERGHAADGRDLAAQPVLVELTQVAEAVGPGEAEVDRVGLAVQLREVGAVVGHRERRERLLDDLPALLLEHALEAGHHL